MDLLSMEICSVFEEKCLTEDYMSVEVQDLRIMHAEKKSTQVERPRRPRRKVVAEEEEDEEEEDSGADRDEKPLAVISLDELAWHDSADDCWVAIYDYVYDCTDFVKSHPGGQDVLLEYAGRDATLAFVGSGHSSGARKVLEKYLVGELPTCEKIFRTVGGVKIAQ